jgi:DHA1 family multidrug resistance protein B-like MFS transporter
MLKGITQLNRTLKLRLLMTFIGVLSYSLVGSSMTIYYNHYLGAKMTGLLRVSSSVTSFVAALIGGHLSDRLGRRPIMLAGSTFAIIGGVLALIANAPWLPRHALMTFFGFLFLSLGNSFETPADNAMIIDVTDDSNRKFVYSVTYWLLNVSVLLGSALSGWFFRDYLFELLVALLVGNVINFLIKVFGIAESFVPHVDAAKKKVNAFRSYFEVLKDHRFMIYVVGMVFSSMIFSSVDYYLPVHLSDNFKTTHLFGLEIYGQRMLSIFVMINTVMIVFLMSLVIKFTKKFSEKSTLLIGMFIQGLGFVLALIFSSFWPIFMAAIIATIGEMTLIPSSQTLRARLMNEEKLGTYSGVYGIAQPVATILSGSLVSLSSLVGHYGIASIMMVITLLAVLLLNIVYKKD